MTPAEKTAWMVRWTLQGRPVDLPWDMFLTVPEQGLKALAEANPETEQAWEFHTVQDRVAYAIGLEPDGWYHGEAGDDDFLDLRLPIIRAQLRTTQTWLARWKRAGCPQAMPLKELIILPKTAFAAFEPGHERFWATDDDATVRRALHHGKTDYQATVGVDSVHGDRWDRVRAWLIGRCRPKLANKPNRPV